VGKNKNAEKREREKDSRETQSAFKGALQKPSSGVLCAKPPRTQRLKKEREG